MNNLPKSEKQPLPKLEEAACVRGIIDTINSRESLFEEFDEQIFNACKRYILMMNSVKKIDIYI